MADVFISYAQRNRQLTEEMAGELENRGYSVWWDTNLQPTGSFHDEINEELAAAKAVVVIWTDASANSEYVRKEVSTARIAEKLYSTHGPNFDPGKGIPQPFSDIHTIKASDVDALTNALLKNRIPPSRRPGRDKATSDRLNSNDLPPFLTVCTNEELDPLVELINKAVTTNMLASQKHIQHSPDHQQYLDEIDLQFRSCAANDFKLIFGKEPPTYRQILLQVAGRRKLQGSPDRTVPELERQIYNARYSDLLAKISEAIPEAEKEAFLHKLITDAERRGLKLDIDAKSKAPLLTILTQAGISKTGFLAFQKLPILTNAVAKFIAGRGLPLWANALGSRALGVFAGPIGWGVTAAWTAYSLAGPAHRVVDPGIDHLVWLRETKRHAQDV
jgi:uncharacterized protein YaaW (UPF0174 family)